jgi:hypothetical protein
MSDEKQQRIDASIARQLSCSIQRNSRLENALRTIADIAEGSETLNSLPNIARISRAALKGD